MNEHFRDEFHMLFDTLLTCTREGRKMLRDRSNGNERMTEIYESLLSSYWELTQDLSPDVIRMAFADTIKNWGGNYIPTLAHLREKAGCKIIRYSLEEEIRRSIEARASMDEYLDRLEREEDELEEPFLD